MKIVLLAVGKRHDASVVGAIADYTARLQRFAPTEWLLVPSPHADLSPDEQKSHEAKKILAQLKSDDRVVLLDERGDMWSTPQVAERLGEYQRQAPARLVFVIGGAHGVSSDVASRANAIWSLSRLVFPHMLVRLILAEQLYRASTILRGEPYHHE